MATKRPLAINQAIRDSIEIHNFIYHILLTKADEVDYLNEVTLTTEQTNFFKEMIAESSRGTKYKFINVERSALFEQCSQIIENSSNDDMFVEKSKDIAQNFKAQHDNRMADGIVIVIAFSMEVNLERSRFIAILKLDYKSVLQQVRDPKNPKHVTFKEISDSLVEDKSSIQKRAIIDVGDSFHWDVIAVERNRTAAKQDTDVAIGTHFKKFLDVTLLMDNSSVTRKAISHTHTWAKKQEGIIPADIKARVINYIEAHDEQNINMDDIRDLICNNDDIKDSKQLSTSFDKYMDSVEFSGVQFTAKANSIPDKEKRTKVKTNKNVTIEWQGEMKDAGVKKKTIDGITTITIVADSIDDIS